MNEKQIGTIVLAVIVVIINGLIGHYYAPNGITFTPIILIVVSALISFGIKTIRPILKSILTFVLIALNDILIKLYSGGNHDSEGLGFVHLFLFAGLIPAFIILLTSIIRDKQATLKEKITAGVLFPTLMFIHLYFLGDLGLGRAYPL